MDCLPVKSEDLLEASPWTQRSPSRHWRLRGPQRAVGSTVTLDGVNAVLRTMSVLPHRPMRVQHVDWQVPRPAEEPPQSEWHVTWSDALLQPGQAELLHVDHHLCSVSSVEVTLDGSSQLPGQHPTDFGSNSLERHVARCDALLQLGQAQFLHCSHPLKLVVVVSNDTLLQRRCQPNVPWGPKRASHC